MLREKLSSKVRSAGCARGASSQVTVADWLSGWAEDTSASLCTNFPIHIMGSMGAYFEFLQDISKMRKVRLKSIHWFHKEYLKKVFLLSSAGRTTSGMTV